MHPSRRKLSDHMRLFFGVILGLLVVSSSYAQTMASEDSAWIKIRLVRAKEIKSAAVWTAYDSISVPTRGSGTHHVLAYTYRYMTGNDLNGDASIGAGSGGGGGPIEPEQNLLEGMPGVENPPGGGGGTPPGGSNESYYLCIPGITKDGQSLQGILQEGGVNPTAYWYYPLTAGIFDLYAYLHEQGNEPDREDRIAGLKVKMQPGDEVTVCYYAPGQWKLPSGDGEVMVTHVRHILDTNLQYYDTTEVKQQEVYYDINRQDVSGDTAVDSRKGYGQPNREGQFPADPNAELRNINFGDWVFKGGMFVGNMPSSSGDRSGTSRFQLFDPLAFSPQDQVTIPRMTVATVYQAGRAGNLNGGMTVGIFAPLSAGTANESDTTWANKWNIVPRASIPGGGSFEQNKDPWRKFTIAHSDTANLLSVGMTKVHDVPHQVNGFTVYKTTWSTPVFPGLCYAMHDEQTLVDSNFTGWRYFADKEFVTVNADLLPTSFRDLAPRYWRMFISTTYSNSWGLGPYGWGGWL